MSIEKEVEKMYSEDAELRRKNQKRKKNSRIATMIMLVLIAVVAVLLAKVLGLLDNEEENSGGVIMNGTSQTESSAEQADDDGNAREFEHIKVSGTTYLYKGSEVTLDELRDIFSLDKMDKDVVAVIEDDNATKETMDELTDMFGSSGRGYMLVSNISTEASEADVSAADTSSAADSKSI